MSNSGGGGEGALGCLFLAAFLFPIVIAVLIVRWIAENPDDVAALLMMVGIALLVPHFGAAWLVLWVCRNLVVYNWSPNYGEDVRRLAIVMWFMVIPLALTPLWFALVNSLFSRWMGMPWHTLLAVASTLALLGSYFYLYLHKPPRVYQWSFFEAEQAEMLLSSRLAVAVKWLQVRLAFLDFMDFWNGEDPATKEQ